MSFTVRCAARVLLPLALLTACGSGTESRESPVATAPASPASVATGSAEPNAGLTGPAVDNTELSLSLGRTRRFWKTWEITYHGLEHYVPADEDAPQGWRHQGPTWLATLTVRNLHENPVRIHPSLTAQSGEGLMGAFGGFLGYGRESDLDTGDQVRLRALVGTRSTDSVILTLDLGIVSQPQITLVRGDGT